MEEDIIVEDDMDYMDMEEVPMSYMDMEEAPMSYMDMEEAPMSYMDMEEVPMSYMDMEEDYMYASEEDPSGAEEEITQDYLSDVVKLRGEEGLATEPSMEDAARSAGMSSVDYLKRASARLDKVATYLEKHGQVKVAYRLDKMADAIDARIKKETK
jgi:hypothetical protein